MKTPWIALVLALGAVACGKKDGGSGAAADADPAPANALVPPELKGKLEFVPVRDERHDLAWVTPKGWTEGVIPGQVKPPEGAGLGFMTKYGVDTNCDGTCEPKDWDAVVDKVEFSSLASSGTVERDDKASGTRTMVVALGDRRQLVMAWWKSGARQYVVCQASLEKEVQPALLAFEAACKATRTGL